MQQFEIDASNLQKQEWKNWACLVFVYKHQRKRRTKNAKTDIAC